MSVSNGSFLGSFELERKKVHFEAGGTKYHIREMDGNERDRYMNRVTRRSKKARANRGRDAFDFEGVQAELLSICLFEDGSDKPVNADMLQKWPASLLQALFDKAQELNGLTEDANEEVLEKAKNA